MTIKKETLISLNKILDFDYKGYEQDWPIEFADQNRISEFINIVKRNQLSIEERYAIVSLILASYDDYLNDNESRDNALWKNIKSLLDSDHMLYKDILIYWALSNDEREEDYWFSITPVIRAYLADV